MRTALTLSVVLSSALGFAACGGSAPAPQTAATSARPGAASCGRVHPGVGPTRASLAPRQGDVVALASAGKTTFAYVADEDEQQLLTINVSDGKDLASTPLAGAPAQVLVLADGRVAVTLRDKNKIEILEPNGDGTLTSRCSVAAPAEPFGLAATDDDATILVTSAWAKKLSALDAKTLAPRFDVDLPREPRAVVVDGDRAFVAHVVGAKMSVVDLDGDKHEARVIDLRVNSSAVPVFRRGIQKQNAMRSGCQGFALAKSIETDDKPSATIEKPLAAGAPLPSKPAAVKKPTSRILAPMVTVDPGEPTVRSAGYGQVGMLQAAAEVPFVGVVDANAERTMNRALMSDGQRAKGECILPRSAAAAPDGTLLVACLGADAVVELDGRGADPARLERRRWSVPSGPTGVAVDAEGERFAVWSQFDRTLTVIDRASGEIAHSISAFVAKPKLDATLALGRRMFHATDDPRISLDGRACASCHPDGREDALTWSTPDGPRQTIMLAGRVASTAPYGWLGAHADLNDHLKTTFQRLGGQGIEDSGTVGELAALTAWVTNMPAPTTAGALSDEHREALVDRGRAIFFGEAQGCAGCHVGGGGTDAARHEVATPAVADNDHAFDTPSLRFIGGTAPYFHDGRYATMEELLNGSDGKMGHTLELPRKDVTALEAYLETL